MKDKRFDELDERIKKIEKKIEFMDFNGSNCDIEEKQENVKCYSRCLDKNIYEKAKNLEKYIENLCEENEKIEGFMKNLKKIYIKNKGYITLDATIVENGKYKRSFFTPSTSLIEALDIVYKRNKNTIEKFLYNYNSLFKQ